MSVIRRPLALAAALIVALSATATAQTVIVTKAPPGAKIEIGLNQTSLGTGTADANGVATVPLQVVAGREDKAGGRTEVDVRVFVDVCEMARRIWLAETGWQPPAAAAGCVRRELFGLFSVRKITSLIVDAGEQSQAVWIRQGPAPAHWLDPNARPDTKGGPAWQMATGLVMFGGAGMGNFANTAAIACGVGSQCASSDLGLALRAGAEFWFGRHIAVIGSYFKPYRMEATGSGTGYKFTTTFAPNIATIGGKLGVPAGRVRLYVEGGLDYQRSNFQTTQTNDAITGTVNGLETTFPGGTQVFNLQTGGWSWYAGGGGEVWVKRKWGIFGDVGWVDLKGSPTAGGEGSLKESLLYVIGGVRLRLGR